MEIKITWTKQAEFGLKRTITYLKENWTEKEILRLRKNIIAFVQRIKTFPEIYPATSKDLSLHKGPVDENNYIVYQFIEKEREIRIINFRSFKQKPIY